MIRIFSALATVLLLAGCAARGPEADDAAIAAVSYRDPGPAYLTLYTMVNNRTGSGGHASLMINASERVIYDPAGSFYADVVPQRDDVLYGITPAIEQAYRGAHARSTYHVVRQRIEVTPEQAEIALQMAKQVGSAPPGFCAKYVVRVLQGVPGFESVNSVFQPVRLSEQFAEFPGVETDRYYEDDDEDLQRGLAEGNARLNEQAAGG